MILDQENLFSDGQAITATAVSTNVIDLGVDRDIGNGEPIEVLVAVTTDFDSAADGMSLTVALETDDNVSFSSATVLAQSDAIPEAELLAGEQIFKIKVPSTTERYLRLNYTASGENATAGAVTAGLILDRQQSRAYASGFSVD